MAHSAESSSRSDVAYTHAVALGRVYSVAFHALDQRYVIDEAACSKLMDLVFKAARKRLRLRQNLQNDRDVEELARLAIQNFLRLRSAAS